MPMRYQVRFVPSDRLPEGVDFAFVRIAGRVYLFVKQSAIDAVTGCCEALDRARVMWYSLQLEEPADAL